MPRATSQMILVLLLLSLFEAGNSSASKKNECTDPAQRAAFQGNANITVLVSGFGHPAEVADLLGYRYAALIQSLLQNHTPRGRIVKYIPCTIESSAEAQQIGRLLGVDLVLWGRVQWRSWQREDPARPINGPSNGQDTKQVYNNYNGSINYMQQNYINTSSTASAMVTPYLSAIKIDGLNLESPAPLQITDHKDLKGEPIETLLSPQQRAMFHLILGMHALDDEDSVKSAEQFKQFLLLSGLQEALAALGHTKNPGALFSKVATSLVAASEYDLATQVLLKAATSCQPNDSRCLAENRMELGWVQQERQALDDAIKLYLDSLRLWQQTPDLEKIAELHKRLGKAYLNKEDDERALKHLQQSLAILQQMGQRFSFEVADSYAAIGAAMLLGGRHEDAPKELNQALALFQKLEGDHSGRIADIHSKLAKAYFARSDYRLELAHLLSELSLRRQLGNKRHEAEALDNAALALRRLNDSKESVRRYIEASQAYQECTPPDYKEARDSLSAALNLAKASVQWPIQLRQTLIRDLQLRLDTLPTEERDGRDGS